MTTAAPVSLDVRRAGADTPRTWRAVPLAIVAALMAVTWLLTAPADADTPRCVSTREFVTAHSFLTRADVHRKFDVGGREVRQRDGVEKRVYVACVGAWADVWLVKYRWHHGAWWLSDKWGRSW